MALTGNVKLILSLVAALGLTACASVSVYKVDRATGKVAADTAEGLRFYLPRPYISVFEPFIVDSQAYLARGEVSPDGSYVLLTQVPQGLQGTVLPTLTGASAGPGMGQLRIESSQVRAVERVIGGAPQAAPAASAPEVPASAASAPGSKKSEVANGILNYKAVNDNGAYAVTPQPRYFNILWLPDFDEQYVVSAKAGLGNAGVVLGFGQGWSLQSLEATVDNSALAKPLLDFYSGTLGSLQKLATAKIEAPLAALTGGGPQGAAIDGPTAKDFQGGTPVTVKITKVRIVAPGLYPVLKPGEMQGRTLTPEQIRRILVPVQPLTNIAFNTYEAIVIEAARTTGDSALRIHQNVDSSTMSAQPGADTTTPPTPADPLLVSAQQKVRTELSKPENVTQAKELFVATLRRDGGVVKVSLMQTTTTNPGTAVALPDDATLKARVIAVLKAASTTVADGDITIQRKP